MDLPSEVKTAYEELPDVIDFNRHVKPILSDKCFACHGPDKAKVSAGLQLHQSELALAELEQNPGSFAIVPRNLNRSKVVSKILSEDPDFQMPPPSSHLTLSNYDKAVLIKWIKNGAKFDQHWAFKPVENPSIPEVQSSDQSLTDIDYFILDRLESNGQQFSNVASNEILLRRLYLDLTGLPPSIEQIDRFIKNTSPSSYEEEVDRILASTSYGEQRALEWMDVARFADTHGYSVDRYRDMSPWRDWVIKAFNENMPYDQFIIWQLAGDLLKNPSREMKLATGFNRNHPQNMEGGVVNEEFLIEYAVDRVSTVSQGLLGLSTACARCHDHKFDPISQKNFYELTSFFNNNNESGQISWDDAMPVPTLLLSTKKEEELLKYLEGLISDKEEQLEDIKRRTKPRAKEWVDQNEPLVLDEPRQGLVASYDLDDKLIINQQHPFQEATMKREYSENQEVEIVRAKFGNGIKFNGDTWLDLKGVGSFGRHQPFTISTWINIPSEIRNGNIFHKGDGAILYGWRGFHLKLKENKFELAMVHTGPDNAIYETSIDDCPKDEWTHVVFSYDGSSKAAGLKLYINGLETKTKVKHDNLYKDILFQRKPEPGLQFGARLRGKGIGGAKIDEIKIYNRPLSELEILRLSLNDMSLLYSKDTHKITNIGRRLLEAHFINSSLDVRRTYNELTSLRKRLVDSVENIQEVMIMKESDPVQAYILERGIYDARGEKVEPNTPEFLPPIKNAKTSNRLGFAKWLFQEDHPLTSRVAVNRIWQQIFGQGLVRTSDDFGNQGELPSHPELLDYLASTFMDSGWNIKSMIKKIVMSKTYKQDSKSSNIQRERDPENILLGRGPSKRLSGEQLRDNALFASGLLDSRIGGQSVKPYQPEGLWRVNGGKYKQDTGQKLYRRSLYTIWKRSVPNPTIATFDAPDRDVCVMKRQETNTPLQALVLLNDPTYIEASRALGKFIERSSSEEQGIIDVFRKLTGRMPAADELKLLLELKEKEEQKFVKRRSKMKGWLETGQFKLGEKEDSAKVIANAIVASTIMNADAALTKR